MRESLIECDYNHPASSELEVHYNLTSICQREKTSPSRKRVKVNGYQIGISAYEDLGPVKCSRKLRATAKEILYETALSSDQNYCSGQKYALLISDPVDYIDLDSICRKMMGLILHQSNAESFINYKGEVENIKEECLVDDILTWINTADDHDFNSWCKVLKVDGSFVWRPCRKTLMCSFCKVQINIRVSLFGSTDRFDRYYTLQKSENGEIFLKGSKNSLVRKENSTWILESSYHNKICLLKNSSTPFVRNIWNCSEGMKLLAFSLCSLQQFACDSGMCVGDDYRCNGVADCDDGSDEENCLHLIKGIGYDMNQFPPITEESEFLIFFYSFSVYSLDYVKTSNFYVDVHLDFIIDYKDSRLTLWNPQGHRHIDCDDAWTPSISLSDAPKDGHWVSFSKDFTEMCFVHTLNQNSREKLFSDPYMGKL